LSTLLVIACRAQTKNNVVAVFGAMFYEKIAT